MVEMDKTHLFNVARDCLFSILIAFSSRKVFKKSPAGNLFTISALLAAGD